MRFAIAGAGAMGRRVPIADAHVGRSTWRGHGAERLGNDVAAARRSSGRNGLRAGHHHRPAPHKSEPGVVEVSPITSSGRSITQLGPPRTGPGSPEHGIDAFTSALSSAGLR